jgi:hypothetical protein
VTSLRNIVAFGTIAASLVLASPSPALLGAGESQIDRAVQGLRSNPVYVDPRAGDVLAADDARRLADEIASRHAGPLYIVVLPESAAQAVGGDPVGVLREIHSQLGRPGVYAGMIGTDLRTDTTRGALPRGLARQLATDASNEHDGEGAAAVLTDFVDRVGVARSGSGSPNGHNAASTGLIVVGILAAALAAYAVGRRRARRRELEQLAGDA